MVARQQKLAVGSPQSAAFWPQLEQNGSCMAFRAEKVEKLHAYEHTQPKDRRIQDCRCYAIELCRWRWWCTMHSMIQRQHALVNQFTGQHRLGRQASNCQSHKIRKTMSCDSCPKHAVPHRAAHHMEWETGARHESTQSLSDNQLAFSALSMDSARSMRWPPNASESYPSYGSETGVKRLGLRILISEIKLWKTENSNEYENRNEIGGAPA